MIEKNTNILIQTIKQNIQKKNYSAVENAYQLLIERGNLSYNEKRLTKRSLLTVAEIYNIPDEFHQSIINLEYARSLTPGDSILLKREMLKIQELFTWAKFQLTQNDLRMFLVIISLIIEPYKNFKNRNFYLPAIKIGLDLKNEIQGIQSKATRKAESQFTFRIEKILNNINPDLTKEERIKKAAQILAPHLIEFYKEKIGKSNKKKVKKGKH